MARKPVCRRVGAPCSDVDGPAGAAPAEQRPSDPRRRDLLRKLDDDLDNGAAAAAVLADDRVREAVGSLEAGRGRVENGPVGQHTDECRGRPGRL